MSLSTIAEETISRMLSEWKEVVPLLEGVPELVAIGDVLLRNGEQLMR